MHTNSSCLQYAFQNNYLSPLNPLHLWLQSWTKIKFLAKVLPPYHMDLQGYQSIFLYWTKIKFIAKVLPPYHIDLQGYLSIFLYKLRQITSLSMYLTFPLMISYLWFTLMPNCSICNYPMSLVRYTLYKFVFEKTVMRTRTIFLTWNITIPSSHSIKTFHDKTILRMERCAGCCCKNSFELLWTYVYNGCLDIINIPRNSL